MKYNLYNLCRFSAYYFYKGLAEIFISIKNFCPFQAKINCPKFIIDGHFLFIY